MYYCGLLWHRSVDTPLTRRKWPNPHAVLLRAPRYRYTEDEAGGATEGQKKYLEKALELLRETPNVEWIQAEACAALASMTSGLCIRKQIDRDHPDWLEDVVTAIMGVKSITQTVKEIDPDGRETRRVIQDMIVG